MELYEFRDVVVYLHKSGYGGEEFDGVGSGVIGGGGGGLVAHVVYIK